MSMRAVVDGLRRLRRSRRAFVGAVALVAGAAAAAPPVYRVAALGVPGEVTHFEVQGLNGAGDVAGVAFRRNGTSEPVVWSGTPYAMRVLADPTPYRPAYSAAAFAINDAGVVAGAASNNAGLLLATVWNVDGTFDFLGQPPYVPPRSAGHALNAGRQVAGVGTFRSHGGTVERAMLWSPGEAPRNLGVLPGCTRSSALALNDAGTVVGTCDADTADSSRAFVWTATGGLRDLGTLPGGGPGAGARGINAADQIVGFSNTAAGLRAVMWGAAGAQDLGSVAGGAHFAAHAINGLGQVVGQFLVDVPGVWYRGFLWTAADGMLDLLSLVDVADPLKPALQNYLQPLAINDAGQILVAAVDGENRLTGYVLEPR